MNLLETRLQWQKIVRSGRPAQFRVAILSTFTAHPLEPYLGMALEESGLAAQVWTGPFNQIVPECLSEASETARFAPHLLVLWPRFEELWGGRELPLTQEPDDYAQEALEVAEAGLEAARRCGATLIMVLPAIPEARPLGLGDACLPTGVTATATRVREALRLRLANQPGTLVLDLEEVVRDLGRAKIFNRRLMTVAHIPFSEELFSHVGQRIGRLVTLSRQPARKAVVVAGDNCLWGGALGQAGPEGVDLSNSGPGEALREFQSFLLELRRAGALLALCDAAGAAEVDQVFARREMRLKKEHLAACRLGEQARAASLSEIARELALGLDDLIFIDSNAQEISIVRAELPQVACLAMPEDPATWPDALLALPVWDRIFSPAASPRRIEKRAPLENRPPLAPPEEYLAELGIKAHLFTADTAQFALLPQLQAKSSQFNLNTRRHTESELAQLTPSAGIVRLVQVQDRHGDYGVVGAYLLRFDSASACLETCVLSRQGWKREIQAALVADAFEQAAGRELARIEAVLEETPRNELARQFFSELGCEPGKSSDLRPLAWPACVERLAA